VERWLKISGLINDEKVSEFGVVVAASEGSTLEMG